MILLLTFTHLELSGQNIKTEAMFLQNWKNWIFDAYWNIFATLLVCISTYAIEQQTSSLWKSYLLTKYFQRRFNLVGLISGLISGLREQPYSKELFRHRIYTIHCIVHSIQNYNKTLNDNISWCCQSFWKKRKLCNSSGRDRVGLGFD